MTAVLTRFVAFFLFIATLPAITMEQSLPAIMVREDHDPLAHMLFARAFCNRQVFADGSTIELLDRSFRRFIALTQKNSLGLIEMRIKETFIIKNAHEGIIFQCGLSLNDEKIITTGRDNKVKIWRGHDGSLLYIFLDSVEPEKKINVAFFENQSKNKIFIDYLDQTNKTWLLPPENLLFPPSESHWLISDGLKKYLKNQKDLPLNYQGFIDFMKYDVDNAEKIMSSLDIESKEYLFKLLKKYPVPLSKY